MNWNKAVLTKAKSIVVIVFGITLFLVGLALMFLPGPGILIIIAALIILASECVWAKKILEKVRKTTSL